MAMSYDYGLVAGRQSRLAVVAGPRAVIRGAGDVVIPASCLVSNHWGPNTPLIFLVASVPLIIVPYRQVPSPMFAPREEVSEVLSVREP